ncbi:MAG: DoxX family protein [Elusimicrobia bacterium]|nr:DoxX family protein [Elusimicrobiota bacterium]
MRNNGGASADFWTGFMEPLARVLIALIFLASGAGKICNFGATRAYLAGYGVPAASAAAALAVSVEFLGGLSLLAGVKTAWGAKALLIFLVAATLTFHARFSETFQTLMFLKNMSILGGLLYVIAADGDSP